MSSEVGEGPSTSSSPSKEKMEAKVKAMNLLAQGKRNLICGEIPAAVQQFQDACQTLSAAYGEMARECAEAYFQYGSALLELARMEQGVLGNALEGVDVEADDNLESDNKDQFEPAENVDEEEREKLRVQVVEAMSEEEIQKRAQEILKQAALQGLDTEKEREKENKTDEKKDAGAVETEGKENDEEKKEAMEGKDWECEDKKKADENAEEADDNKKRGENVETGEKLNDGAGSKPKVSSVLKERELNKKVAEISTDEKKEGEEMEGGTEETEPEGGSGKEAEDEGEKTEDTEEEEEDGNEDGEGEEEEGGETAESQKEGEVKDGEEDPDDISNLQLAWEMLELSKIIYSKDPSKESQVKAAESCLKLGEVSLESEQYEQAIADLQLCLTTQKEHLEPCDRAIAETYYNLGMAYQMNKQFDQAIDSYKSAVKCLEEKIEKLKIIVKEKPPKDPSQFVEPAESAEKEIQQIQALLPDIKEKIADSEEEVKEIENLKKMAKEAMGAVFSAVVDSTSETGFGSSSKSPATSSEDKKATNISHLIRKKRKPDGEEEDPENKKQKQESEGGSGDGPGPVQNGHAEKKDDTAETVAAT